MGAVNTTYTFTATDTITSTKMNNIIDQTTMTSDAVFTGGTIEVVSGKLRVAAGKITSNEMGANSVITAAIADSSVTTAKLANSSVTAAKIANSAITTTKIEDSTSTTTGITTEKIANESITAAKLNGAQSGSAPVFGVRAFGYVNSSGTLVRGEGIASVSKVDTGHYLITLSISAGKMFYATASCDETNNYNNSAKVTVQTFTTFRVFTGFEDTAGSPSDSGFYFMVIY